MNDLLEHSAGSHLGDGRDMPALQANHGANAFGLSSFSELLGLCDVLPARPLQEEILARSDDWHGGLHVVRRFDDDGDEVNVGVSSDGTGIAGVRLDRRVGQRRKVVCIGSSRSWGGGGQGRNAVLIRQRFGEERGDEGGGRPAGRFGKADDA